MRRPRTQRPDRADDVPGLAGWLYTDLLLALAVVFLGAAGYSIAASAASDAEDEAAEATTTTSTTTTIVPTSEVPVELCTTLGGENQIFRVENLDPRWDDATLQQNAEFQISLKLAEKGLAPDSAIGFSLAFGGPDLRSGPDRAQALTSRLQVLLPERLGLMRFRSYGDTSLNASTVNIDMFPLVQSVCPT